MIVHNGKLHANRELYIGSADLARIGWTEAGIKRFLGNPSVIEKYRAYSMDIRRRLWLRSKAEESWPDYMAWQGSRSLRKRKTVPVEVKRAARFAGKYPNWRGALPVAAELLFSLNRYAKHDKCSEANRTEIYSLKNEIIRILYQAGMCVSCVEHKMLLPEKVCFGCSGSGVHWSGDECNRCDGTGTYRFAKTLTFVNFAFEVGGKRYNWHQPSEYVSFDFKVTGQPKAYDSANEERAVGLAKSKFSEAKALLRWIIGQECAEHVTVAA